MAWLESPQGRGIVGSQLPGAEALLDAEFTVGDKAAIAGWEQGVLGMRAGGVRWLVLPPNLAYGDEGREDAGIPPSAVVVFRIDVVEVRAGEPSLDAPIPGIGAEQGGVTIASAIKTLRLPSESGGEDDDEWEDDPVGGAEVVLSNEGEEARGDANAEEAGEDGAAGEAVERDLHSEEQGVDRGAIGAGGSAADDGGEGGEGDSDIKLRMARLAEQGGIRHQLGEVLAAPHAHHHAGGAQGWGETGVVDSGGGAGGYGPVLGLGASGVGMGAYVGGGAPSGFVIESLTASRKGQEELAGAVREVKGGVEEVRSKVDRLLEQVTKVE